MTSDRKLTCVGISRGDRGYSRCDMTCDRNFNCVGSMVCDRVTRTIATQRKEEIQSEIEWQQELGKDRLLEEDCYLIECNLGNLEAILGIRETYWLFAIIAAREAGRLKRMWTQIVAAGQNTT